MTNSNKQTSAERNYVYFISYVGDGQIGRCEFETDKKIVGLKDIDRTEIAIENSSSISRAIITNWILFREEKVQHK